MQIDDQPSTKVDTPEELCEQMEKSLRHWTEIAKKWDEKVKWYKRAAERSNEEVRKAEQRYEELRVRWSLDK